ncbi:hypothetical protein SCLCIDRAFT_1216649 [Scleroderma citrinum Foug A]|uniref:Uncharacterized protein n=1 Tax=Scleroderma citrinum Foug A TaxID=1036808 RepID=A0A0C3DIU5_9AGAM|nr:hypothetical protein SCLCIDRAFT_1216649 [Scleroderma citrinum Foug A]
MTVTEGAKHNGDLPMLKQSISETLLTEDHNIPALTSATDNQVNESASSSTSSSTGHRKLKRQLVWVDPKFLRCLVNAKWDTEEKRCEVQRKLELLELQQLSSDHSLCYTS